MTDGTNKFTTPSPVRPLTMGEGSGKEKHKPNRTVQMVPAKVVSVNRKVAGFGMGPGMNFGDAKQAWMGQEVYEEVEMEEEDEVVEDEDEEQDSEETQEDGEGNGGRNGEGGWGYGEDRNGDDEETEDED